MNKFVDIAIIGSGPAGLAAAVKAKENAPGARVLIIEKMKEPAKKLSASGNGRGNLSNRKCKSADEVLRFFSETGIAVRMDNEGRIYPYSEDAKAVTESLVKRARMLGVEILLNTKADSVEAVHDDKGSFHIFVEKGKNREGIFAEQVLIATGGKSFAVYGSTGDGQIIARKLGHTVNPMVPSLTAIEIKENISNLKGTRAKVQASLFDHGESVFCENGEIQFREDCISGICIMNMSSKLPVSGYADRGKSMEECKIVINFMPDFSSAELVGFLKNESDNICKTASDMLKTLVKTAISDEILKISKIALDREAKSLTMEEILTIANGLRMFTLTPTGRKGWKEAQVTKGGIPLEEIDDATMESKLVKGLYFAGEVTDYDGPCGGYNLNNAWITGIKAGRAMAADFKGE